MTRTSAAVAPIRRRKDRIQIEFVDFRKIGDQLRNRDDDLRQRGAIDRRRTAHPAQNFRRHDSIQHRERIRLGRGREAKVHVLEHLDQHAAEAERDHLAKARIGQRADDHLMAAGEHLLDEHAADLRVRVVISSRWCRIVS